ncbi:hypothetical protein GGQ88_001680 [Novosphingobium hassiacum]|uniref:Uncharacterized protein n=1 Tax=Novosphingobium hassiacum TaxID=173676 RepID=A0A7W5ZXM5_9SPHN|nr:hypothetical protein [Novosphingobium hassiacum]MBB3860414.1 hypothetical protein [Novosphingobium hassiacum]
MIQDAFEGYADSPIAPAQFCFSITPSDTADLPRATKALYVGTGGSIVVLSVRGTSPVTFANVQDGTILDVRTQAVRATGTTASNIVGLA